MLVALLACRSSPDLEVVAATDLGPLPTTSAIKGRDGGYSVGFGGRTAWFYGDTILSLEGEDGSSWRDNSWSWSADLDPADGLDGFDQPVDGRGAPREFFPETPEEAEYNAAHAGDPCDVEPCGAREVLWPMAAVHDPERDQVLAFYVKIHGEPGAWNFFARGYGVAVWDDPDAAPTRPEVRGGVEPTLLFGEDDGDFGDGALIAEGQLYAFACEGDEGPGKPCRLGRVAPADVLDRAAWRFWDGREFTAHLGDARPVFEGNSQLTVHWSPLLERYLAIYVGGVSDEVVMRTAPAPEGPWSEEETAFTALAPADGGWVYCGLGHAELQQDDGRYELVSYYRGTGDWTGEVRLVEVELAAR